MERRRTFTLNGSTGGLGPLGAAKSISAWSFRTAVTVTLVG